MEQPETTAKAYITDCFEKQGDFDILPREAFEAMLAKVMTLDETFMKDTGVLEGAVYDDDAAYDYLVEEMGAAFPQQKMYCMRFVEDYMDNQERYLDSIGLLEWE
ncbi:MAG: hypothetical protein FWE69_00590 [Clostridiales bacterium]|nr:hypothetical protein [Clostridiales bacterium]